jgi:[ribosomal protein S18]-alanine N-acetyltransferase
MRFPFTVAELPELLAVPGGSSHCIGEPDAGPLGFGQYRVPTAGVAHLSRIIVAPHARGRGIGKSLCTLLIAHAVAATAARAVTLRVYRDNAAAMAVYAGLGFACVDAESTDELSFMRVDIESSFTWKSDGTPLRLS